jgi:hypothetical protein
MHICRYSGTNATDLTDFRMYAGVDRMWRRESSIDDQHGRPESGDGNVSTIRNGEAINGIKWVGCKQANNINTTCAPGSTRVFESIHYQIKRDMGFVITASTFTATDNGRT